ncbi:MAG: hypothetical protein ACNS60_16470 [Candidatus Cyclobacteriaceae bacterium M2_1C_046]
MTKTFTQSDAILYVYGEFSEKEEKAFEDALLKDDFLRDEVQELLELQCKLDRAAIAPSQKVIDNIISYSKSFNLHPKL